MDFTQNQYYNFAKHCSENPETYIGKERNPILQFVPNVYNPLKNKKRKQ